MGRRSFHGVYLLMWRPLGSGSHIGLILFFCFLFSIPGRIYIVWFWEGENHIGRHNIGVEALPGCLLLFRTE